MKSTDHFEQIVDSFRRSKSKPHTPRFRIAREQNNWRIFDGEKAVALFMPLALDIWSFSPFEPDEIANFDPPGKVVDLHTVHNTFINFGCVQWPKHWLAHGDIEQRIKWTWIKKSGKELVARVSVAYPEGETGQWLLRVSYDPSWGRYRYTFDIDVRKFEPGWMEVFNLMTAGALTERPETRRWTHSIWQNPDGELRRIVHSNALLGCTDYVSGVKYDETGPWRWRNVSYPRAWVGYAAHESFNPVILIHRTNVPVLQATCSQLFDEHICWNRAGQDNLDSNGYFHFQMSLELVNLKASLAKEFLKKAKDPMKPKRWHHEDVALPFYMDRINSFEQAVDPWKPEDCPILIIPSAPDSPIVWDQGVARTGRRSIRLKTSGVAERCELVPNGAVCRVRPHSRYRLTGWIKTRSVVRFARLELVAYEYSYNNITALAVSPSVSGSRNWTRVTVEIDSGEAAYLLPKMVLYQPGTAWFDDVSLELIK